MAHSNQKKKVLLIEPSGGFIRLDRCMQSIDSWGGVYRFPLNLARIAAALLSINIQGYEVRFIDLQADSKIGLKETLKEFRPDLCILSSGFPSMRHDAALAREIKTIIPKCYVSTFGVAPTLLGESFFLSETWGFDIPFDFIVIGGEPALAYKKIILGNTLEFSQMLKVVHSEMEQTKKLWTLQGRKLFDHSLYRSPFTGEKQTYIEGSYGCPKNCSFCVVPLLYGGTFSKRSVKDILTEFQFVIERNHVRQISLWDEGTTFQRKQIKELCEGLIELRKHEMFKDFSWNTRSTTALLDEEIVSLMKQSGMSGITLGLESFDEAILESTGKGTTIANNVEAIRLLSKEGIFSIGHIVLGLPEESRESAERTIAGVIDSGLDIAQFYCAVPYPGTILHAEAQQKDLIRITDLTQYELCNPIMDTLNGLSHAEVGQLRRTAMEQFYTRKKKDSGIQMLQAKQFERWSRK